MNERGQSLSSLSSALFHAMTQERRRYGFVLERQCSLAKHYASFHEVALAALHPSVDKWREVAATREYLPQSVEDMFASRLRVSDTWNISPLSYSFLAKFIARNAVKNFQQSSSTISTKFNVLLEFSSNYRTMTRRSRDICRQKDLKRSIGG